MPPTNVLLVFADQMRGQAMTCAGNSQVPTPNLDRLADAGVLFTRACCNSPVCTPSRGSLLTGRYPVAHRAYVNDMPIRTDVPSLGTVFRAAGYATGYVGKWHLDGVPRDKFTPPGPRRLGFDTLWAVHNCTHAYLDAFYYRDTPERIPAGEYEPLAHTALAEAFIREQAGRPWCLAVSYGTPHDPYQKVPERWRRRFRAEEIELRPNVPADCADRAREDLAGYYAHVAALDDQVGRLLDTLDEQGLSGDTLVVFTSDHGDMHGSQGMIRKQKPWEESISIPLILRGPGLAPAGRRSDDLIGIVDLLPTVCGLTGTGDASAMQGRDLSAVVRGEADAGNEAALLLDPVPVDDGRNMPGWWGLRTPRHTYARTLDGPWVLYDNVADPFQLHNLAGDPAAADLCGKLDDQLRTRLEAAGEPMRPWPEIIRDAGLVEAWNARELELHPPETGRARLLED